MEFDRRSGGSGRQPLAQINVTPLVDVMLVLADSKIFGVYFYQLCQRIH